MNRIVIRFEKWFGVTNLCNLWCILSAFERLLKAQENIISPYHLYLFCLTKYFLFQRVIYKIFSSNPLSLF